MAKFSQKYTVNKGMSMSSEKSNIELTPEQETEFNRQWDILPGTSEITPEDEFKKMLRHSIKENKPLRVKCGIDPTNVMFTAIQCHIEK